jgi:hypothetical protein
MFGHIRVVICAYHAISDECMANACYISAVYGDLNFNGITMQEKVFLYAHTANIRGTVFPEGEQEFF